MDTQYRADDRRPIASREHAIWQHVARRLTGMPWVTPNGISMAGVVFAAMAGACLFMTPRVDASVARWLFVLAAVGAQLRLLANMFDGMVAVARGTQSPLGELFNEIPDRFSDAFILIGAGYALTGNSTLGYLAALLAVMTAYIRAIGKTVGVRNLFLGPMSKSHRMAVVTAGCVYMAIAPVAWQPTWHGCGIIALVLAVVAVGAAVTCVRRLVPIVRTLKGGH